MTALNPLTVWISLSLSLCLSLSLSLSHTHTHTHTWNFKKDGNTRILYLSPEKTCVQVKMQQLEPYKKQRTDSIWKRSTWKLYIVTLLI